MRVKQGLMSILLLFENLELNMNKHLGTKNKIE